MPFWWMAAAAPSWAGPLGPFVEDTAAEEEVTSAELPSCAEGWPFALQQVPEAPDLWFLLRPDHAWATPTLVETLEYAATRMALLYPDVDPLLVGDLSTQKGGPLPPHRTHDDGRSADIGIYGWTAAEQDVYRDGNGFPPVSPRELDLERTWTLIESLLETGAVEHILLGPAHIARLKAWLLESGRRTADEVARIFPPDGTPGMWTMGSVVRPAANHEEHLHVRVRCATEAAPAGS